MTTNSGDNWDLVGEVPGIKGRPTDYLPGYKDLATDGGLMTRVKLFYDRAAGAWEENRRMHSEDLNFAYNSEAMGQWDPVVLQNRRGKPCYTFNRVIGPINLVTSDMRQTRPAGKVRPASDGAKEGVADIFGGLCRSIELASRADTIYKEQYKYAVAGGFGAWRVMPVYMTDRTEKGAFDQVIRIINISNPQTVIWDPQCADPCGGDANQVIVAERISEDVYKALYKDENGQSFNVSRDSYGWYTDKEVRIAEYFERVPVEKRIAKYTSGEVKEVTSKEIALDKHLEEQGITAEEHHADRIAKYPNGQPMIRKAIQWKVMWVKVDGTNVLEGPIMYDWKRIPVIRCPGRYVNIEGRKKFQSLIRHSKDAQRSYNSRGSDMIERAALIPKAPYLVTAAMIKGYETEWAQANVASRPYLPYNLDPKAPNGGMPFRMEPIDLPQGAIALAQMAIQDIQATIGMFDPALGNAEDMNRVSGKALVQHTRRSDLGAYEFVDGFSAALQLTWEIMVDMIPFVYDSHRVVQIVGVDGVEKLVNINQPGAEDEIINDLQEGEYDVTVTIGPSYQTARQEMLATLIDASEAMPAVAQFCPDLLVKNLDTPDAIEMSRRLRIPLIKQGIVQPTEEEKKSMPQGPDPQEEAQKMEQALLQAKLKKTAAEAEVATHKAGAGPLYMKKELYEVAGKHLGNIKLAHDIGNDQLAAQAEAAAAGQEMQQDQQSHEQELAHAQAQHEQDLAHAAQAHASDMAVAGNQHALDLRRTAMQHSHDLGREAAAHEAEERRKQAAHDADMRRMNEKHAAELKHASAMNQAKVAAAKAMAKAKPKAPKKKAA